MSTSSVLSANMSALRGKLRALQAKAARLGLVPLTWTETRLPLPLMMTCPFDLTRCSHWVTVTALVQPTSN